MDKHYFSRVAGELGARDDQVEAAVRLLDGGATVPFIARYRKEATGSLDEVAVTQIRDRMAQLKELDNRRATVLQTIKEQGNLTPELKKKILAAETLAVLEDIYLPYRPKRKTRGFTAKEKGLEPLAQQIFKQEGIDVEKAAEPYINADKKVTTTDEALAGSRDIIAEWVNEDTQARAQLRALFEAKAMIRSRVIEGREDAGAKFKDYFQWEERAWSAPSHRILAVRRGEKEKILVVDFLPRLEDAVAILTTMFIRGKGEDSWQVLTALEDSYKRLLSVSLETEFRLTLKKRADQEAIEVFKNNLRELIMAPPLGQKRVLAIDPGYRTGCKIACLNEQGQFLCTDTIYPTGFGRAQEQAAETLSGLVQKYEPDVIAIGNGTASRETERFVRALGLPKEVGVVVVSESGASVYSASDAAREEFPEQDVTVRGAVSIGRRLMDPLAELVKIDPKAIGVGQYQHDVDQNLLRYSLDDIVISCVNQVGVEVNTASKQLLMYVSGLGPARAQAIVEYRNRKGPFTSRQDLLQVDGFGPKAFEQAAGFLRIHDAAHPLDASAVHPESYRVVDAMAKDLNCTIAELMRQPPLQQKIKLEKYVTQAVGLPTLQDIRAELAKPGRDPREAFQIFSFKEGITTMDDLKDGMVLPGVVTNVTAFGAFVDIGVHQDGLVHISEIADRFVKDPHQIVKVHQKVEVRVLSVDRPRHRIALSMKKS